MEKNIKAPINSHLRRHFFPHKRVIKIMNFHFSPNHEYWNATLSLKKALIFPLLNKKPRSCQWQAESWFCCQWCYSLTHWGRVTQICVFTLQLR